MAKTSLAFTSVRKVRNRKEEMLLGKKENGATGEAPGKFHCGDGSGSH